MLLDALIGNFLRSLLQLLALLFQCSIRCHIRACWLLLGLMPVGFIKRPQIFANLLVKHCHLFCQALGRHDLLAAGCRLDPGALDSQQFAAKQLLPLAEANKFSAHPNNGLRVTPTKVRYGLVGW